LALLETDTSLGENRAEEKGMMIRRPRILTIDAQKRAQFRFPSFFRLLRASKGSYQSALNLRNRAEEADAPSGLDSLAYGSVRLTSLRIAVVSITQRTTRIVGTKRQRNTNAGES